MSSTILIVEADQATARFLTDQLTADGYTTAAVATIGGVRGAAGCRPTCCSSATCPAPAGPST
jgi:hypothetical protein